MTVHQPPEDRADSDGPADEPTSSPTVQPEPDEPNSLPPVVPDDEPVSTTDEPSSLPPVLPDDEPVSTTDEPNSLPPVVPDEPDATAAGESDQVEGEEPAVEDEHVQPTVLPAEPTDAIDAAEPDPSTAQERAVGAPASVRGWAALGSALTPRANRAQLVAGLLCAVLGFALVAQVRQSGEADLGGMRQGDLVRILDETTNRGDALARESADLARERDDLLSGSDRRQAALDALRRQAETQGILTGRLPAEGPGVVVTLTEPGGYVKPITMLNMLEELRNAGAEAIQLNDQRVTASSAFTGTGGAVLLDGVELTAPYRWIAIGDPDIIAPALQIPGGAMAQVRNNGGKGTVEPADELVVDAVRVVPDPVYATPVAPQGD